MSRITELLERYNEYKLAEAEVERRRANNEQVKAKDEELAAKEKAIKNEIEKLRMTEAKKIWAGMEQDRFSYGLEEGQKSNPNPYYGPDFIDVTYSTAYMSVMGLKLPVGKTESNRILSVEELMVLDEFNPKFYTKGLLEKFKVDPEGTKKAVAETLRVRFMKDEAEMPVEIKRLDAEIETCNEKIEKLERLVAEELPDNVVMRKIFKKKFELKEKAPKEIEGLKMQLARLVAQKENCEYRLKLATTYKTPDQIMEFIEKEYVYLVALCDRDYKKEVSATSQKQVKEVEEVAEQRKENRTHEENVYEVSSKMKDFEKAFNADFVSLEELYGNKEFVEELKSMDISKLSEEEKKIITALRDSYEQYLMKAVQKYEE